MAGVGLRKGRKEIRSKGVYMKLRSFAAMEGREVGTN